jgi:hypothetical protein
MPVDTADCNQFLATEEGEELQNVAQVGTEEQDGRDKSEILRERTTL